MNNYATLDALRRSLGLSAVQHADDDLLLDTLGAASRLVERHTGRVFYPRRQVRGLDYTGPGILLLDDDLLDLHALTNGDGASIALDAVRALPANEAVKSSLALDRTRVLFATRDDPLAAISVDGTWGCHPDWARAWADSGDDVQNDPLGADETVIAVADADGPWMGGGPRFSPGRLIRIGSEYLSVLAVDTDDDLLTVERGANGTTASVHPVSAPVELYLPPEDVRQVCLRVAAWLYKQRDAGFVQAAGALRGQIAVPPALPDDVTQILGPLARIRVA